MKQMKVALTDHLRARLDAASEKSGRSVAEEIRARVEASFTRDAVVDKPTRDLVESIAGMAAEIALECGAAWHTHAGSHEALVQAIISRLDELKPKGSTAFGDRPHATTSEDDPKKLGAIIEFRLRRQPDFTGSSVRQWMEEEHQKSLAFLVKPFVERLGHPVPPPSGRSISPSWINEPPQQDKKGKGQQKPDQQKKRGK